MSMILEAPYPGFNSTTILPSPVFGDSINTTGTLDIKRSMNNRKYSYIKSRDKRKRFLWTFLISKYKALELQSLFDSYNDKQFRVTDHNNNVYLGYFTINPFEFEALRRASASVGQTLHQIQLQFEGFEQ